MGEGSLKNFVTKPVSNIAAMLMLLMALKEKIRLAMKIRYNKYVTKDTLLWFTVVVFICRLVNPHFATVRHARTCSVDLDFNF